MDDIRQQNEWAEFRAHLRNDIDSQVTSNKALLWVSVGLLTVAVTCAIVLSICSFVQIQSLQQKVHVVESKLVSVEAKYAYVVSLAVKTGVISAEAL